MRRKSNRNTSKSSPEKAKDTESTSKSRRSRRSRRKSSRSSDSEDEKPLTEQKKIEETPDTAAKSHIPTDEEASQEPSWKVTPSADNTPGGDTNKLKICLTRPSPDSHDKSKSRRSKSRSQTEDDATSNEDKSSSSRHHQHLQGSPVEVEDKKGKGKSRSKHKSNIEQSSTHLNETNQMQTMNNEISENAQVTPQSPTIDKPDYENDCNNDGDLQNVREEAHYGTRERDINETVVEQNRDGEINLMGQKSEVPVSDTSVYQQYEDGANTPPPLVNKDIIEEERCDDKLPEAKPELELQNSSNQWEAASEVIAEAASEGQTETVQDNINNEINTDQENSGATGSVWGGEDQAENQNNVQGELVQTIQPQDAASSPKETQYEQAMESTTANIQSRVAENDEEPMAIDNGNVGDTNAADEGENSTESTPEDVQPPTDARESSTPPPQSSQRQLKRNLSDINNSSSSNSTTTGHKKNQQPRLKWSLSLNNSSSSTSPTGQFKIDLETLQNLCPNWNIEFPAEPDLVLEQPKEKRRKSSHSESSVPKHKTPERKVSVEFHTPPAPAAQKEADDNSPEVPSKEDNSNIIAFNRKISIVEDTASKLKPPPSPAKNPVSDVLFITNLVRPFTLKQLKELLERTGKIKEDGFWTDRIKSKCYVHYESAEAAEATRNALHGVQWPIGNGKNLMIDYATVEDLEKARNPPPPPAVVAPEPKAHAKENLEPAEKKPRHEEKDKKDDAASDRGSRTNNRKTDAPMREWDIGKKDLQHHQQHTRNRSRSRGRDDSSGGARDRAGDRSRDRERNARDDNKGRKHRKSRSPVEDFITKKQRKQEESAPQKLMDDLFLKTKATPSIYWQPLSPEEIMMKQQQRLIRMEEHKRRMEETARLRGRDIGRGNPFRRRYE